MEGGESRANSFYVNIGIDEPILAGMTKQQMLFNKRQFDIVGHSSKAIFLEQLIRSALRDIYVCHLSPNESVCLSHLRRTMHASYSSGVCKGALEEELSLSIKTIVCVAICQGYGDRSFVQVSRTTSRRLAAYGIDGQGAGAQIRSSENSQSRYRSATPRVSVSTSRIIRTTGRSVFPGCKRRNSRSAILSTARSSSCETSN